MTPYLEVIDLMKENARLQKLVDEECRRAEDAHGLSLRQSLELERLTEILNAIANDPAVPAYVQTLATAGLNPPQS